MGALMSDHPLDNEDLSKISQASSDLQQSLDGVLKSTLQQTLDAVPSTPPTKPADPDAITWMDGDAMTIAGNKWLRGAGQIPAQLLILGEKPTRDDNRNNKVFTGDTGGILHRSLIECVVNTLSTYYTNVVKYMPANKKAVTTGDLKVCRPMLMEEIRRVQPQYILCLGANALKAVAGKQYTFSTVRGEPVPFRTEDGRDVTLFATYSPSFLNHDPSAEEPFKKDLRRLAALQTGKAEEVDSTSYVVLKTVKELRNFCSKIFDYFPRPLLSLDCEWDGATWMSKDRYIRTVQLGFSVGQAVVIDMRGPNGVPSMDDELEAYRVLKTLLEDPRVSLIGHNVISDGQWLASYGIDIKDRVVFDTMLAEYISNESGPFGLEELTARYTKMGHYERDLSMWVKAHAKECRHGYGPVPDELLHPYGAKDVDAVLRALPALRAKLDPFLAPRGESGQYPSLWDMTMLTQRYMYELEGSGLLVDQTRLNQLINAYQSRKDELRALLIQMAANKGVPDFNPAAPAQVSRLLFDVLGLTPVKTTGGKQWSTYAQNEGIDSPNEIAASTDKTTLEILEDHDPIVKYLLNYRRLDTACKNQLRYAEPDDDPSTKGGGIPAKIWPDGRLHSHFSPLSETGRFRHSKPNCFPPGTEVLSDKGWIKFEQLKHAGSVKLAQFDRTDETISFSNPIALIEQDYDGDMVTYRTEEFVDLTCTADHDIPVKDRKGRWVTLKALQIRPGLSHHKFWHAGRYVTGTVAMRPSQLILAAALQADGTLVKAGGISWKISKVRKIERLRMALRSENIPFREVPVTMGEKQGVRIYVGKHAVPPWLWNKKFWSAWILDLNALSFSFLADEVWKWDGAYKEATKYCSKQRENAEWVQLLATLNGRRSSHVRFRTPSGEYSSVNAANHAYSYMANGERTVTHYIGKVYCATMPKGTLVVRCDGKRPIITCNCANWPKKAEGYMEAAFGGKDKVPPNIRSVIVPPPGWVIMEGDFKQAELFVMAYLANDPNMIGALTTPGKDLHDLTGMSAFKMKLLDKNGVLVPDTYCTDLAKISIEKYDEFLNSALYRTEKGDVLTRKVFKDTIRVSSKSVSFGIAYGRGARAMALAIKAETGTPTSLEQLEKELEVMIDAWKYETYPDVWRYLENCSAKVLDPGYLINPWGRYRRFPRRVGESELAGMQRVASNFPIQSTVADCAQIAMHLMAQYRVRHGLRFRLINQIHDAIMIETPEEEVEQCRQMYSETMGSIDIPIRPGETLRLGVDVDVMTRWGEKVKKAKT